MTKLETAIKQFGELITNSEIVLVLQPEKPDTDSLCSGLALEQILGDLGKTVILYSKDELPNYINYFEGADRLTDQFPDKFDLVILVDTGGSQQIARTLEKFQARLAAKPFVVIDHHASRTDLPFPTHNIIEPICASTGELLVQIAGQLNWTINPDAARLVVPSIMADTLGLTIPAVTPETVDTVAAMMRLGVSLYDINQQRLAAGALTPELIHLKGKLLTEAEFVLDGRMALLIVSPEISRNYAKLHDPAALVIYDLQHIRGVEVAIVIRDYAPKIKLSLRANTEVAAKIAEHFGGGGHPRAAGATIEAGEALEVKAQLIKLGQDLLQPITRETL